MFTIHSRHKDLRDVLTYSSVYSSWYDRRLRRTVCVTGDTSPQKARPMVTRMSVVQPLSERALDMIAYASKWAIAAGSIYGLVEKVGKPYYDWRKNRWAGIVREALKPELEAMNELKHTSDSLTEMIELVLLRQKEMFEEMDMFMVLASDNKDRHDETNDLLTAAGFSSDRRFDLASRERIETLFRELNRRKTERLRLADREKKAESVIAQILKP